jgi:cytochrome c-type biogenesis protein CcmH
MIWLATAALIITAFTVWYLARPLGRTAAAVGSEEVHQLQQVRARLLSQMNELDIEEADRNIDKGVVSDERLRLETDLAQVLRDLDALAGDDGSKKKKKQTKAKTQESRRLWVVTLIVLGLLLPLAAAGLYAIGQRATLAYLSNPVAQQPQNGSVPPMALEMVARLEKRLAEQPDDAAGWSRLGRAYAVLGRPDQAKAAYARSYKLSPEDPQIISDYAWLLYNENPKAIGSQTVALYNQLTKFDPENQDALWVLGFAAYQQGDGKKAIGLWERLIKQLPAESAEAEHLRSIIAKAREKQATK